MKNIKVDILHVTPQEVVIKAVAKPYKNEKADLKLVKKVGYLYKHESVLEHININMEIIGISRLCLQELARHRLASYTVESTRFTLQKLDKDADISEYFVIPDFENDKVSKEYNSFCKDRLNELIDLKKDEDLKNDKLKYFLPENFRTNLIMSLNVRSMMNFLNLRHAKGAHFEIRHLAHLMIEELKKTYLKEIISFEDYDIK